MRASRLLTCSYFLRRVVAHRTHFPYNKLSGALPVVCAVFVFLETFGCECSQQADPAIAQEATTLREQSDYLERTIHVSYTRFHSAFLFSFLTCHLSARPIYVLSFLTLHHRGLRASQTLILRDVSTTTKSKSLNMNEQEAVLYAHLGIPSRAPQYGIAVSISGNRSLF